MRFSTESLHDLRDEPAGHLIGAALDRVKAVRPGTAVTLIVAEEPSLLMASLNLQLRENLAWKIVEADGAWRVTVRHREDVAADNVLVLLAADHKRIDGLLARALGLLNQGEADSAVPLLREHREIGEQLKLVEEALAADPMDATELGIYCGILSGTLAKHEYREEHNLFPLWRLALLRRSEDERKALLALARVALARS